MIEYFVGASFSFDCPCLITYYFLVLGQRLHFSITKLLSHLKIKGDLDSCYEEQQFVITRDSFDAYLFNLELNSSAGAPGFLLQGGGEAGAPPKMTFAPLKFSNKQ